MNKNIVTLIAFSFFSIQFIWSQEKTMSATDSILKAGIALHEDKKYESAIETFGKISDLDNKYLYALIEKANSQFAKKDYKEALSTLEQARGVKDYEKNAEYYVSLGNVWDQLDSTENSMKAYNEGVQRFPQYYLIYYNKAIALIKARKYQEATENLKKAIYLNPYHTNSHYLLGSIAIDHKSLVHSIFGIVTSILLSPDSPTSLKGLRYLNQSLNLKYVEPDTVVVFTDPNEDFSKIESILRKQLALSPKYTLNTELDLPLTRQLQAMMTELTKYDASGDGFSNTIYVPLFKKIMTDNQFQNFIYYILLSTENEGEQVILKKKISKIKEFDAWLYENIANLIAKRQIEINGKQEVLTLRYNDGLQLLGNIVAGKKEGKWIISDKYGNKKWEVTYRNDLLEGKGIFYHSNGKIQAEKTFHNGLLHGPFKTYYENGNLEQELDYRNDLLEGKATIYHTLGGKANELEFKNGKRTGNQTLYFENGTRKYQGNFINDLIEGESVEYYSDGSVETKVTSLKNYYNGTKTDYYPNGKMKSVENFANGDYTGDQVYYYPNGKKSHILVYKNKKLNGTSKEYFGDNEAVTSENNYANGKLDGISKTYTNHGTLDIVYKKDEAKSLKAYDANGTLFKETKFNGKEPLEVTYADNTPLFKGSYYKEEKTGDWIYYYPNGTIREKITYDKGKTDGINTLYYENGNKKNESVYEKGIRNGPYKEYYLNGQLKILGNYINGSLEGLCKYYGQQGQLIGKYCYNNDKLNGKYLVYSVEGTKSHEYSYDNGTCISGILFDDQEKMVYTTDYSNLNGLQVFKGINNAEITELEYKNGNRDGKYLLKDYKGNTLVEGSFINDMRDGVRKTYGPLGSLENEVIYKNDAKEGLNTAYNVVGDLIYTENYFSGDEYGPYTVYYYNKKIQLESTYFNDQRVGDTKYYGINGELILVIHYEADEMLYYMVANAKGELSDKIPVKNETVHIKATYKSGGNALDINFVNGMLEGDYTIWADNGKPLIQAYYKSGYINNERKIYYTNGNLYSLERFLNNDNMGISEYYWENNNIRAKLTYKNDVLHGDTFIYDDKGNLLTTKKYYDGHILEIR